MGDRLSLGSTVNIIMRKGIKIGILHNPNSRNGSLWYKKQISTLGKERVLAVSSKDVSEIPSALAQMANAGVTHLAIVGGDGTLDAVLTALRHYSSFENEPIIGLFNAGTTNMTFKDLGFKTYSRKPLLKFIQSAHAGRLKLKSHKPLRVQSQELKHPLLGFFLGVGAIPRAIHYTRQKYHKKGITNSLSEGAVILSSLWRLIQSSNIQEDLLLKPIQSKLTLEQGEKTSDMVMLSITSLEKLLIGLRPYKTNKEHLSIMGISHPYNNLIKNIPELHKGTKELDVMQDTNLLATQSPWCTIAFDGEWTLDGEMFQSTHNAPLEITLAAPLDFAVGAV